MQILIDLPLYKKEEKSECSNYRGISLLNTAYKILATAINNGLKTYKYAEDLLSPEEKGFRRKRSTTNNIFIMRQILQKCYEYNIDAHVLFIDFKRLLTLLTDKTPYRYYRK